MHNRNHPKIKFYNGKTMSEITASMVNELRQHTGAGLMECKKALTESNGDFEKAIVVLKKKGIASAEKKASRDANQGMIQSYIHPGARVGVLLELKCETDFVAKNEEFQKLARDICMHIAAMSPAYISPEDVPADVVAKEREVAAAQCKDKPAQAIERIIEGKLAKWYSEQCLLKQPYIKNQDQSVESHIAELIAKIGENIKVGRFSRFQI
ncbi:MAG: translation elongation factor Ts [Opitutales bacterium]|nr:translation elongation factor Ts [Opitutales bacterium]